MKALSKGLNLRPIREDDLSELFKWRNTSTFLNLCTHRKMCKDLAEFKSELESDFLKDRHLQFMISVGDQKIGTIYSYGYHKLDAYCFFTVFISETHFNIGYGLKACVLFLHFLFKKGNLFKVYIDVYEYNHAVINLLKKLSLQLEGILKMQHIHNKKRYDVSRYAIYVEDLSSLSRKLRFPNDISDGNGFRKNEF